MKPWILVFAAASAVVLTGTVHAGDEPGACCFPVGDCLIATEVECASVDGTFQGSGTECADVECPAPTVGGFEVLGVTCEEAACPPLPQPGACCMSDRTCEDLESAQACNEAGGVYQGAQSFVLV